MRDAKKKLEEELERERLRFVKKIKKDPIIKDYKHIRLERRYRRHTHEGRGIELGGHMDNRQK